MNNTYKLSALWMMCLMLLGCLSFSACDNGDEEDTNQYKGGINLNVFGPSPVARGGELRFLGSGMDKVQSVSIPGCGEITEIEVVSANEIRITVPQTAEVGYVILKTPTGEITTKTKLTYTEPIGVETIAPNPVKPGEVLVFKGEYLNLIKEIIFFEDLPIGEADFIVHSRKEIQVKVPMEARTGEITMADATSENKDAMRNLIHVKGVEIILPSVEAPLDLTAKKPGDMITIEGQDFDLVEKVLMPNGDEVEFAVEEIAAAAEAKSDGKRYKLNFTLPDNTSDGAIVMVPASGVPVVIANIGMALPADVVATPATGLRGGSEITLTGINMELVTTVTFPGVEEPVEPASKSATEVKVVMPGAAVSGDLLLNTASGASVPVAIATLKPEFMSFANSAVSLGSDVTIQGKNLDLVTKVIYTGGAEVEVTPASATELTVSMPTMGTESGVLTLVMGNGETVETGSLTINTPEFCYIPVLPGEDEELKGGEIFTIAVENGDKLTGVEVDDKAVLYIINNNRLVIAVPQLANANTKVKLISSNGTVEYPIAFIPATNIKNEVWKGLVDITWGEGGRVIIPASAFKDVPAGARMVLHYAQKDQTWAQAQINYGDFTVINFTEGEFKFEGTLIPTNDDVYGWTFDNRSTPLVLTQEILNNIQAKQGECEGIKNVGIIIQGSDLIFSSVTLEWEISLEQDLKNCIVKQDDQSVLMPFPIAMTWDDAGRFRILIDKEPSIKDMKLVAGKSAIYFYVSGTGQLQINDANWTALTTVAEWSDASVRVMELVLTQEMVDCLKGVRGDGWSPTGLLIQGDGMTISKITILP